MINPEKLSFHSQLRKLSKTKVFKNVAGDFLTENYGYKSISPSKP